jgi:hypothetical protein
MFTAIKYIPGSRRGALRAYRVTQVSEGARRYFEVVARNGIQAINQVRRLAGREVA